MKIKLSPETVFLLKKILRLIGFLISVVILIIIYQYLLAPEIRVNNTFAATQCMAAYKKLEQKSNIPPRSSYLLYRPSILVFYEVKGKTYQAWTYDILRQYGDSKEVQQAMLDKVEIGKIYDCWYDPAHPQTVVLLRGYNFYAAGGFIIALITALVLFFSLFRKNKP